MSDRYYKGGREVAPLCPLKLHKVSLDFSAHILLTPRREFEIDQIMKAIEKGLQEALECALTGEGVVVSCHLSAMERNPVEVPDP